MDTRARPNVTAGSAALVTVTLLVSIASVGAAFLMGRAVGRDEQRAALTWTEEPRGGQGRSAGSPKRNGGVMVVIYMDLGISEQARRTLRTSLDDDPAIERFEYLDHAAAHEEFERLFVNSPELIATTDPEELPTSFKIVPEEPTPESVQRIKDAYDDEPGVWKVVIPR
jgi:hypothetical protein